jgi:hypothetical protein
VIGVVMGVWRVLSGRDRVLEAVAGQAEAEEEL